jgi:hypothetical protein
MFYKFLHTEHIESVLRDGTIVVSSLKYFRDIEDKQKPWIGDRLEGATELTTPERLTLTEGSAELEAVNRANIGMGMFKQFAQVSGGGRIEMGGVRFVHQVPSMHIYSCSSGSLDDLRTSMCVEAAEPYSACLRINDPVALAKAILDQGEVLETKVPVSAIFEKTERGMVLYEDVTRHLGDGPVIVPSPFKKAPQFAPQREYRLAFSPAAKGLADRIFIKVPEPGKHFAEEFRSYSR